MSDKPKGNSSEGVSDEGGVTFEVYNVEGLQSVIEKLSKFSDRIKELSKLATDAERDYATKLQNFAEGLVGVEVGAEMSDEDEACLVGMAEAAFTFAANMAMTMALSTGVMGNLNDVEEVAVRTLRSRFKAIRDGGNADDMFELGRKMRDSLSKSDETSSATH